MLVICYNNEDGNLQRVTSATSFPNAKVLVQEAIERVFEGSSVEDYLVTSTVSHNEYELKGNGEWKVVSLNTN
jgi:hypothetical protein